MIQKSTLKPLQDLAYSLDFVVDAPGDNYGKAATPAFLDSLAAAYERDPAAVKDAFRLLGVFWQPESEGD
jgi:hypothetical protein